jgi:hypothetical protein
MAFVFGFERSAIGKSVKSRKFECRVEAAPSSIQFLVSLVRFRVSPKPWDVSPGRGDDAPLD